MLSGPYRKMRKPNIYRATIQPEVGCSQHRPDAHAQLQRLIERSRPYEYRLPTDGRKWRIQCSRRKQLAMYLVGYRHCYPGLNRIAAHLGWSRRTVCVVMAELKELGVMAPRKYTSMRGTRIRTIHFPLVECCTPAARESCTRELPKKFHKKKEKIEITEPLSRRISAPAPEQLTEKSPAPHPDIWDKATGFDIPDKDLQCIVDVIRARGVNVDGIPRDLLAFMVEKTWMRATRPERHWKSFYATSLLKILSSEKAYRGALHSWEARTQLHQKWFRDNPPDPPARVSGGDGGDYIFDQATGIFQPDLPSVMWAITHPDGHLDTRLAHALSGVRVDLDSEFGLVSFSVQGRSRQ